MRVTLAISEGPHAGQLISVRPGDIIEVGRSEEADASLPADSELSSLHFAVACEEAGCIVRDLESTNGTFLNGERISSMLVQDGDQLTAGRSTFTVHIGSLGDDEKSLAADTSAPRERRSATTASSAATPQAVAPAGTAPAAAPPAVDQDADEAALARDVGFNEAHAAAIAANCEIHEQATALLAEAMAPADYAAALLEAGLTIDAIHFLAHALPKRTAVWWAARCVETGSEGLLTSMDAEALKIARAWVADPSDENRRAAMTAAEALGHATPASWVAMGAFLAAGSVAPVGAPDVPVADTHTARAVAGAALLAAVVQQPEHAPAKREQYVQDALRLAKRRQPWSAS